MALLYAADMYTSWKITGIKEKFRPIETAEEAKDMLRSFHKAGLMHNVIEDGKCGVNLEKCLGCGLCVSTCKGGARSLIPRDNYKHEDVITTEILLGKRKSLSTE